MHACAVRKMTICLARNHISCPPYFLVTVKVVAKGEEKDIIQHNAGAVETNERIVLIFMYVEVNTISALCNFCCCLRHVIDKKHVLLD